MLGALSGLLLLLAAQTGDLSTPFSASARPLPCLDRVEPVSDHRASAAPASPWDQIRQRELAALCVALARAQVQLHSRPDVVLKSAHELGLAWPGRPEPRVLEARAHGRLEAYDKAWAAWLAARERGYDFRSGSALRDYAVTAVMSGQAELALVTYRRLMTLLSLWPDPMQRQRLYVEAAAAALRQGTAELEEASGYLAAARPRATSTGLRAYVAGMDGLLAHRRGQGASALARIDAAEAWYFVSRVREGRPPSHWPVLPRHEVCGAASLLIERYSSTEALELWEVYTTGLGQAGSAPGALELARQRLARLKAQGERTP